MNLTKSQKISIGILHFLPIIGIVIPIMFILRSFSALGNQGSPDSEALSVAISSFSYSIFIIGFLSLLILIFDIVHLVKSNKNDTSNKIILWILILFFGQGISSLRKKHFRF